MVISRYSEFLDYYQKLINYKLSCLSLNSELLSKLCRALGETLGKAVKELDIKSTDSRKVNFANVNNNLQTYIPTEYSLRRHDDTRELEELNNAIDQVRSVPAVKSQNNSSVSWI